MSGRVAGSFAMAQRLQRKARRQSMPELSSTRTGPLRALGAWMRMITASWGPRQSNRDKASKPGDILFSHTSVINGFCSVEFLFCRRLHFLRVVVFILAFTWYTPLRSSSTGIHDLVFWFHCHGIQALDFIFFSRHLVLLILRCQLHRVSTISSSSPPPSQPHWRNNYLVICLAQTGYHTCV